MATWETEDTQAEWSGERTDVDGGASLHLVDGPTHGSLVFSQDGSFSYSPDASYNGSDSFTCKANDRTVDMWYRLVAITPVNDAPIAGDGSGTTALVTSASRCHRRGR